MRRLRVDPAAPDAVALESAAAAIGAGGVVILPTDTLYGLAVDPFNPSAVQRILALKGRVAGQALPLIAADLAQATECIGRFPPMARALAARFWPGPLTLLLAAPDTLAPGVTAGTGRVGVRVPSHAVALSLCRVCHGPLTATSANLSGRPASADPDEVMAALSAASSKIDILLDAGLTPGGPPSTIVDVTGDEPRLVRTGAISWDDIRACLSESPT